MRPAGAQNIWTGRCRLHALNIGERNAAPVEAGTSPDNELDYARKLEQLDCLTAN